MTLGYVSRPAGEAKVFSFNKGNPYADDSLRKEKTDRRVLGKFNLFPRFICQVYPVIIIL